MVNSESDKRDYIIQSIINQRNNAMNALSELEADLYILRLKISEIENRENKQYESNGNQTAVGV